VDKVAREQAAREKFEHDLDIARSIQQGLLPSRSPEIEGFEIAGWSQPADQTGGDYYDWQALPDGKIVISLADVTGHGIGPALVTAVCRAYSRASFPSGHNLKTVMDRINKLLVEDLPADRFVTFVAGLLDAKTACMQLLSAGHGPIFVYRAECDRVEDYGAQGIPFGLEGSFEYDAPQEVEFAPGDMLILFTDGFFEWANPEGKLFGTETLKEIIRAASHLPPGEIISRMHSAVLEFAQGTPQQDDLTAVVVKRTRATRESRP
jgi:serine phosphatase RsbU (regulator of sigma subunit)